MADYFFQLRDENGNLVHEVGFTQQEDDDVAQALYNAYQDTKDTLTDRQKTLSQKVANTLDRRN